MSHSEQRACVRCGRCRTVRPTSVLCLDYQEVAAELGELATWLGQAVPA